MKSGSSIIDLATRLADIQKNSHDYVVPASKLEVSVEDVVNATQELVSQRVVVNVRNGQNHAFVPTSWAHSQLAEYADIPKAYYDRVNNQNPDLLAQSLRHGFAVAAAEAAGKRGGSGRILRAHGNNLRAVVSSRYRRLDNADLFEAVAPSLIELGFEPESVELTDKRLYLKVVSPKVEGEILPGDVVQYGLVVSGSDVGAGSVRVEPLIYRLVCKNGLITQAAIRQAHLGKNQAADNIEHLLSDETKDLSDRAFWNQIRDVVRNFAKPEFFQAELERLREAAGQKLTTYDFPEIVERTQKAIGANFSEGTKTSIIEYLANGADGAGLNKWGLANAVTFAAQAKDLDYDSATDLERAGNKVIELSRKSWEVLNTK